MSIKAINWAIEARLPDAETRLILILIANFAGEWGIAWPGQRYLMDKTGSSRTTVWRRVGWMEEEGLLVAIKRRAGGRARSNCYLLAGHPMAPLEEWAETYAGLGIEFEEYREAWQKINVSQVDVERPPASTGERLTVNASQVDAYTLNDHTLTSHSLRESAGARPKALERSGTFLVNEDLQAEIDETLHWLKGKKGLRSLSGAGEQDWIQLFAEIAGNGITLADFRVFYEWCGDLDWVTGAVTPKLMRSQVEVFLARGKLKNKRRGGTKADEYNERKKRAAELFGQSNG